MVRRWGVDDAPPLPAEIGALARLLSREALGAAVGVCRPVLVERWAEGRHRPRGADARRLTVLARAVRLLRAAGRDDDELRVLLDRRTDALGGTPLDALRAGRQDAVLGWAAALADPAPHVTVRLVGGGVARVRRRAGRVEIDPPAAAADPLVAAVAARMRESAARPRPRPAC